MEGKLLKILEDFVYFQNGKSEILETSDLNLRINSFWFKKFHDEIKQEFKYIYEHDQINFNIDKMSFLLMGRKIIFVQNKGEIRSNETDEFFEILYNNYLI